MSAEPVSLEALLESVADGANIDWDAVETAAKGRDRRLLRHLRLVAGVAEVHRTIPPEDEIALPPVDVFGSGHAAPRWGHLRLLEKIGEGAFGEVYRARDPWLDREVALKLLRPEVADRVPAARLVAEARTLARVRHPNVVMVYGADRHDGRVGLWMELVRGRTLAQIVAAEGPFSAAEASVVGQEICRALSAVHAAGLVHRDLKAPNVMREGGGRLVLMDFGAGQTPLYLGPELLAGGDATTAGDIYALGVLLYYLVTGRYPVTGTSLEELRQAHTRGDRRPLGEARPDLPDVFVAAVERALDPDPARRFASAREMQEGLARVATPGTARHTAVHVGRHASRASRIAVAAAMLLAAGIGAYVAGPFRRVPPPGAPQARMVAILPLDAGEATDAYFADGITEALIQELSQLETIRVIARTSVMPFKHSGQSITAIARALNADVLLEGSVQRAHDDVRINVRLIYAGSDAPAWARTFHRRVDDVIALQRDVALAVAQDLPVVLDPAVEERWSTPQAVKPASYDEYLRGRSALNELTRQGIERAIRHFEEAVRLDPDSAQAYAALAVAYARLSAGRTGQPLEAAARARAAARAALDRDVRSAEAHAVLGEMAFFFDWDWTAADQQYRRALALNPSLDFARERYAMYLAARRRLDEALTQMAEARRIDPASLSIVAAEGGLLRYARRYDAALERYRFVLEREPDHYAANLGAGRASNEMGRFEDAAAYFRRILAREPGDAYVESELAQSLAGAGRTADARKILETLERDHAAGARFVEPIVFASLYARLGDRVRALEALERGAEGRSSGVLWAAVDARLDPIRQDARFGAVLRRLGL